MVDWLDCLADDTLTQETRNLWRKTIKSNYQDDEGRRRARMAAINLRERDGLHGRLFDVRCPVLWLHVSDLSPLQVGQRVVGSMLYGRCHVADTLLSQGTADAVYSVANAEEEIKLFVNSPDARLQTVEGGAHFLSASHPKEVDEALIQFVGKYSK